MLRHFQEVSVRENVREKIQAQVHEGMEEHPRLKELKIVW